MQGWDAVKAALNPFAIGRRRRVPPGAGPGRVLVFAVDGSREADDAVRFGLDNVARANDTCAFACAYKRAPRGARAMDPSGLTALEGTVDQDQRELRLTAEKIDRERCEKATTRAAEDARLVGVAGVFSDVLASEDCGNASLRETLSRYCASRAADIVVVGSRGFGSIHRAALHIAGFGSVSEHLMRHGTWATLLVKRAGEVVDVDGKANSANSAKSAAKSATSSAAKEEVDTVGVGSADERKMKPTNDDDDGGGGGARDAK